MSRAIRRGGRRGVFVAIGIVGVAVGLITYATGFLERAENSTVDRRFEIRGEQDPPDDLALVLVDDRTFSDLGVQWPFPRSLHGRVIDRLRADGAGQIAFDVQFTEPTTPRQDNALITAVGRARPVVLSTTEVDDQGRHNVFGGEAVLRRFGARAGDTTYSLDSGGVIRRLEYNPQGLESFAVVAVEARDGAQVDPAEFPDGSAWIDFHGPPGTIPATSYSQVLRGDFEPGTFTGKTVVVGASAPSLQDLHHVPTSDAEMSGPEVQANSISTVERGLPLRSTSVTVDLLLIALISFLPALLFMRRTPLRAFGLAALAGVGYLVAAQLLFSVADRIVPVFYPTLGLAVSTVGGLGASYLLEAVRRQRLRDTFARFVPEAVVEGLAKQVIEEGDGVRLGGSRYDVTVLFSDIRGFTTFSEERQPEEVLGILNRYLSEMTEAILDNGGTLVSFMGDGIMAVFGAPIEQSDNADRALAAAREMIGPRLKAFNDWAIEEGLLTEPFRMGVGLNSGPVMAGQVGSERRLDYTAIGDTANTAARLEGMTKGTPHQLFVSESTRDRLSEGLDDLEYVDELEVRGREHTIKVWSLKAADRRFERGAATSASRAG